MRALAFLVLSSAHAWSASGRLPLPAGCPRLGSERRVPARMIEQDEAAKRAQSGKAALCSTIAGMAGSLPFLLVDPNAFTSPAWEFQADGLAIMLFLFGAQCSFPWLQIGGYSDVVVSSPTTLFCSLVFAPLSSPQELCTVMPCEWTTTRCSSKELWEHLSSHAHGQ